MNSLFQTMLDAKRDFRIRHNGYGFPSHQYATRDHFYTVFLLSFDGVRLSVVYGPERSLATIYLRPPDTLFELGKIVRLPNFQFDGIKGVGLRAFYVNHIEMRRPLERQMLQMGSTYRAGLLGAEIAYAIALHRVGQEAIVIEEPSRGGKDLYSSNGLTTFQVRLLTSVNNLEDSVDVVRRELSRLISKLKQDFYYGPKICRGFAILSFVDFDGTIKSLVLRVERKRR